VTHLKQHSKSAFLKSLLVTLLFIVSYQFYNIEFVRDKIEDFAFDTINKYAFFKKEETTQSPHVFLFTIDDLYMREQHLFDEENETNYGYTFPRDQIANFIEALDELSSELDEGSCPTALFIDYDFSFTTMPYGKRLSKEDITLINTLKKDHTYTIFLPKTSKYNFIEQSQDPIIQKKIQEEAIRFVSVSLLQSNDTVRRYVGFERFDDSSYISADIALWQIARETEINLFQEDDIIGNRILFKAYRPAIEEASCSMQQSYWRSLHRYSANCSLFDIPYEDFNHSIIMLGGTHSQNNDTFSILNIFRPKTYSGIDIHANTLMTLFYLNRPLTRLPLIWSIILVFTIFFLLDLAISLMFEKLHIQSEKLNLILLMLLSSITLFSISSYLFYSKHLWFNWSIPAILFQGIEMIILFRKKSTKVIFKIGRLLKR